MHYIIDVFSLVSMYLQKKIQYYGLGGKGTYKSNMTILFNLKLLCFIPHNKVNNLFKRIKKNLMEMKKPKIIYLF